MSTEFVRTNILAFTIHKVASDHYRVVSYRGCVHTMKWHRRMPIVLDCKSYSEAEKEVFRLKEYYHMKPYPVVFIENLRRGAPLSEELVISCVETRLTT